MSSTADGRAGRFMGDHDVTSEMPAPSRLETARCRLAVRSERDRIARNLHDSVIQRLFAAGLHLRSAIGQPDATERTNGVIDEIDAIICEIRTTIFTMQTPRALLEGLEMALRATTSEASRVLHHDPRVELHGAIDDLPPALTRELLTVVRELLTNVAKHAEALATDVRLSVADGQIELVVDDDGVGWDHEAPTPGRGLSNLAERAEARGGTATVSRRQPRGTRVTWRVPMPDTPCVAPSAMMPPIASWSGPWSRWA